MLDSSTNSFVESEITKILQSIIDSLLKCKPFNEVVINLIEILSIRMPINFSTEFSQSNLNFFFFII